MKYNVQEIKKGIKLHEIQTEKFKTNLIAIFLSMPITKEKLIIIIILFGHHTTEHMIKVNI